MPAGVGVRLQSVVILRLSRGKRKGNKTLFIHLQSQVRWGLLGHQAQLRASAALWTTAIGLAVDSFFLLVQSHRSSSGDVNASFGNFKREVLFQFSSFLFPLIRLLFDAISEKILQICHQCLVLPVAAM